MKNKMLVLTLLFGLVLSLSFALTYPTTDNTTTSTQSASSPLTWSGYVTANQTTTTNNTVIVTPHPHAPPVQPPGGTAVQQHMKRYRHQVMNQSCEGDMCMVNATHAHVMNMTPREVLRHRYAHMSMYQIHKMKHAFVSAMNRTIHHFMKYRDTYKNWAMVREKYEENKQQYQAQYFNATKALIMGAINMSMVQLQQVNATAADRLSAQNAMQSLRALMRLVEQCKNIACIRSKYPLIKAKIQANNLLYAYDQYQKIAAIYLGYITKYDNLGLSQVQEIENELTELMTNMQTMNPKQIRMKLAKIRREIMNVTRQVHASEQSSVPTNTTTG